MQKFTNIAEAVIACGQKAKVQTTPSEQNDIICNHNMIECKQNHNMTHNMEHRLSKQEYVKIVSQLDKWNVYAAKKLIKEQVDSGKTAHLKECLERTAYQVQSGIVRNAGAYFRKTLMAG